jgi:hypothetical protein
MNTDGSLLSALSVCFRPVRPVEQISAFYGQEVRDLAARSTARHDRESLFSSYSLSANSERCTAAPRFSCGGTFASGFTFAAICFVQVRWCLGGTISQNEFALYIFWLVHWHYSIDCALWAGNQASPAHPFH